MSKLLTVLGARAEMARKGSRRAEGRYTVELLFGTQNNGRETVSHATALDFIHTPPAAKGRI